MFILELFQLMDAGLAKIVIPLSFSSSPESINLSSTTSFSLKDPLCFIRLSIKVVLPWSTWAIMVMFLISVVIWAPLYIKNIFLKHLKTQYYKAFFLNY